ncbi:MAG: hypothetical protein ACKOWX_07395 [Flavobacteriales bacterium]
MKKMILLALLAFSFNGYAQLLGKDLQKHYPTRYYFESQRMQMFRELVSNDAFLPTPLGERANEIPLTAWSQQLGICAGLGQHFYLDGGVSWLQNGEAYSFKATASDSTYSYQTHYRYLALPLQLKFTAGNKLKVYGGLGLVAALYQGYKQDIQWTNPLGAKYDDQIKINNNMNSSTLSWLASAGLEATLDENYSFRVGVLYRKQVNNSYSPYEDYIHKSFGWGLNFGLSKNL